MPIRGFIFFYFFKENCETSLTFVSGSPPRHFLFQLEQTVATLAGTWHVIKNVSLCLFSLFLTRSSCVNSHPLTSRSSHSIMCAAERRARNTELSLLYFPSSLVGACEQGRGGEEPSRMGSGSSGVESTVRARGSGSRTGAPGQAAGSRGPAPQPSHQSAPPSLHPCVPAAPPPRQPVALCPPGLQACACSGLYPELQRSHSPSSWRGRRERE